MCDYTNLIHQITTLDFELWFMWKLSLICKLFISEVPIL